MNSQTLLDVLQGHVERRPDATAYSTKVTSLTFAGLSERTSRIANALLAVGIGRNDRVACLTKHHTQCLLLTLAACKIGAVCVPVNWRLSPPEIEFVLNHSRAMLILLDEEFAGSLLAPGSIVIPNVRKSLCTERSIAAAITGFEDWYDEYSSHFPPLPVQAVACDAALQLYSSGTTGVPKGVVLSHRSLVSAAQVVSLQLGFGKDSVLSNLLPTFHISGMLMLLVSLHSGGKTWAYSEFDPIDFIVSIGRDGITHAVLVPAMISLILQSPAASTGDYRTLELITYGGSPISQQLLEQSMKLFGCDFLQIYGLTEVSGSVTALFPEHHRSTTLTANLLRSAGVPAAGARIRIVDPVTLRSMDEGESGEIWVESPRNLTEYWLDPDATRQAFPEGRNQQGGWFRTGDCGYLQDGFLFIKDRLKDMIISGGENIYPAEIENVLAKNPYIADCAIIGVPDETWGESVKGCVVLKENTQATDREIIDWMRDRLAHYKCPKSIDFMDAIPRNPSGKILKKALRAPYWRGKDRAIN